MRRVLPWTTLLLIAISGNTCGKVNGGADPIVPLFSVTGLNSIQSLGKPIVFEMSLSNPGPRPITVIALTEDMVRNGYGALTLLVSVTCPDGREFRLFPARWRSAMLFLDPSQLVPLEPGGSTMLRSQWDRGVLGEGMWHFLSGADWDSMQTRGSYSMSPDENILTDCFNESGQYRIRFQLTIEPFSGFFGQPKKEWHDHWTGDLQTPEILMTISGKRGS